MIVDIGLWPTQCFALQENGLPRQCAHWLAMTQFSMISAAVLLQSTTKSVIANQPAGWCGNPHLCIRRMLSPLWGDNYRTVNYNLSFQYSSLHYTT